MKLIVIAVCLFLMGCNNLEQATFIQETDGTATTLSTEERPPSLSFKVGETVIKTDKGTYSWSFFDGKSKKMVTTLADHAAPTQMVNIEDGVKLDVNEPISATFTTVPNSYEIRVWDEQALLSIYETFGDIKQRGNYIIEIVGYWDAGSATYVAAVEIL
ncbi:MAG: hypothetical protein ABS951_06950 [Solibacillus sp.]